jgi:hypothetical protein
MKPSFLNLFMKWLTRGRVVPMISASVSWLIGMVIGCGPPLLPLAEIRQHQERSRQALFARIEQLIDQVRLDVAVAGQQMSREQLAKRGLVMEDSNHFGLAHPHDLAIDHCPGRRQPQRLANQAAFAEELIRTEDGDDGFLALLGLDHELDPAFMDVEDRVRRTCLREDDGILGIVGDRATVIDGGEKRLRIEGRYSFFRHDRRLPGAAWPECTILDIDCLQRRIDIGLHQGPTG